MTRALGRYILSQGGRALLAAAVEFQVHISHLNFEPILRA